MAVWYISPGAGGDGLKTPRWEESGPPMRANQRRDPRPLGTGGVARLTRGLKVRAYRQSVAMTTER